MCLRSSPRICRKSYRFLKTSMNRDAVVISIAAGISSMYLKEALGFDAKVVTVMPNTPLLIGYGATAMA